MSHSKEISEQMIKTAEAAMVEQAKTGGILDLYTKIDSPIELAYCPVCGDLAHMWRYAETPDSPSTKAVMCQNGDRFGPQSGILNEGCLLYMPPDDFYRATAKEAAHYWNEYALILNKQRRGRNWKHAQVLRGVPPTDHAA